MELGSLAVLCGLGWVCSLSGASFHFSLCLLLPILCPALSAVCVGPVPTGPGGVPARILPAF